MNNRAYVLRYHELALKGGNRNWFEEKLAVNARKLIQRSVGTSASVEVKRIYGRIMIQSDNPAANADVEAGLERIFGANSYSPIRIVPTNKEAILQAALEEMRTYINLHGMPKTFRVKTRRSDKALPEKSVELDHFFGGELKQAHPEVGVSMTEPELTVGIEIRFENSFIWTRKVPLHGGLPVGTNGPTLALMSGGLDSPVAAIQTLRRGADVSFLHFYGTPFVGPEALEKVEDLVRLVNRYNPNPEPLLVVPFGKIQEKIALVTNPKMRTVLYRRMMVRIACAVAKRRGAMALVTGESLGQVASQTLENLSTINAVSTLPILRPLITHDKDEIIALANKWGTFDTSIRPADDCCTLFSDRHPATRTKIDLIEEQEALFPVQEYVDEAVAALEIHRLQ